MTSKSAGLRVRPATRQDIPAIVMICTSSVTPEEDIEFGTPSVESAFADVGRLMAAWREPNRVGSEEVVVAEIDGRVVGCVTVEDRDEELELVNIDVPRDLQGQGIGTGLVRYVEERARREGKRAVTLGTSRTAAGVAWKSFPWWQSLGYRVTGEEENAWTRSIGPGVREIRMRKDLSRSGELLLREVSESDLPIFFRHQLDPTANYLAAFTGKDPSDRDAFSAHWKRILGDDTVMIKTIVFGGHVAGHVASFVDERFGKPEVTYWIGREHWGKGIGTKALSEFLRLQTTRPLYGRAAKDNGASIRVMQKCGFTLAGTDRGFANARGEEIEEVILVLTV